MYETVKVIRLSDMDEVKDFVRAAGGCDFDIDVKCDRTFIDAKSLLGMIGLGVKKNLQVCYGGKNENFENVVDRDYGTLSPTPYSGAGLFIVK